MRRILFVIESDPRSSHRPAEAIRIAAGVGGWKRSEVRLFLCQAAASLLTESSDALMDGENFEQYLPLLADSPHPIYIGRDASAAVEPGQRFRVERLSPAELATLAAESDCVVHF